MLPRCYIFISREQHTFLLNWPYASALTDDRLGFSFYWARFYWCCKSSTVSSSSPLLSLLTLFFLWII